MKKNLTILEFEPKKTKADKKYTRFQTDDGTNVKWMSCFDTKSSDELEKLKGKTVSVEVIQSGDFWNIKKYLGDAEKEVEEDVPVEKPGETTIMGGGCPEYQKNSKTASMYTSYAKDIYCSLPMEARVGLEKENMNLAISLVKQAKEAFE